MRGPLTQGARSALQVALLKKPEQRTRLQRWMASLQARVGYQKALVAIANKRARLMWAILDKQEQSDAEAWKRYTKAA